MTQYKSLSLLLISVMALLMSACSDNKALLETIPAEADFVATLRCDSIINASGGSVDNDNINLTPILRQSLANIFDLDAIETVTALLPAIDNDNVVLFGAEREFIMTFKITDAERFDKIMSRASRKVDKAKGYKIYISRMLVLVKGDQAWMLESSSANDAASTVSTMCDKAAKRSFAKAYPAICERLGRDEAVTFAANLAAMGIGSDWLVGGMRLAGPSMLANMYLINQEGQTSQFTALKPYDTEFMTYVPAGCNLISAMGVSDNKALTGLLGSIAPALSFEHRGMLESLLPFLANVDGTLAICAKIGTVAPYSDEPVDLLSTPVMVFARMSQADIDKSTASLIDFAKGMGAGILTSQGQPGLVRIYGPGLQVYVGGVGGYFTISTILPQVNSAPTDLPKNEFAFISAEIPAGVISSDFESVSLRGDINADSQMSLKISMPGKYFLESLLSF